MNEANLIGVRIYGEKRGNLWVLVTLDFGLGTQARTLAEALERINRQIEDYLFDAYCGSDNKSRSSLI
ncbi:MAG: hypothetical protein LUC43_07580, partial [Burkholderiales bacterium]|nr:hypothetical protein [Burkholderiales bacterium]